MGTGKRRISTAVRGLVGRVERVIARAQVIDQVAVLELAAESLAIGQEAARARAIVRGAELALAIVPAAVQAPVIVPVEARVPGIVQVEAVPVRSHLRARLAVPLRTKSVITPHHRGLVPLLGAEDLAAEVETTREPAATEAVIAWEVAE